MFIKGVEELCHLWKSGDLNNIQKFRNTQMLCMAVGSEIFSMIALVGC